MTGELIKVGERSFKEETGVSESSFNELQEMQQILDFSRDCMKKPSNQSIQMLTDKYNRRPEWLRMLYPGKFEKAREDLTIDQMKLMFKGEQELLEAHLNLQISMAKRMSEIMIAAMVQSGEGQLARQGMQIKADLTAFSQVKLNQMKILFDKSRINYAECHTLLVSECERHKDQEHFYNRFKRNLEFETDNFFDTIEELLTGFKDTLRNKLSEYKTS